MLVTDDGLPEDARRTIQSQIAEVILAHPGPGEDLPLASVSVASLEGPAP